MTAISNSNHVSVSSSVIENYIQRVTELSQSSQRIPTIEEVEKIAAELGIEPDEIEAAQKQSHDHYIRAQGYMRLKHWDDAICELQEAVAFNPSNLDMLLSLASSHMGRWQEKHLREDEMNVRFRVRQCLAIKPDSEEALNLLDQFSKALKRRKQTLVGMVLGFGGIVLGISGFVWLSDTLPSIWGQPSKLDRLEQVMFQEMDTLYREKEALKAELLTIQDRNNERYQRDMTELQSQINYLERKVTNLQRTIREMEKPEPIKITPKPSNSITIP